MRLAVSVAVLLAGAVLDRGETEAAGLQSEAARRAAIVARVGTSRSITVGQIEDRIQAMPEIQRATFGDSDAAVRHRFLSHVMVREALLLLGAEADGLLAKLPSAYAVDRALSNGTVRAIQSRLGPGSAVTMDEVRAYYESNRTRYQSPERLQLWRILCATREDAQMVLDLALKDPTPKTFSELARDHSLDKATRLRAGNVGFVADDGTSNEPGLRVDPAIVLAAQAVQDGQFVPRPVAEGDAFAVVWRRGTLAASKRGLEAVAAQIRDAIWADRVKRETDALVSRLRASNLRDFNPAMLDDVDLNLAREIRARQPVLEQD
jgi:peptidyl-prolyl cis-trans isomerase C